MSVNDVKQYIAGLNDLSTLPVLLAKIVKTCNDPNAAPPDIVNLITYDPALAERILRVANSVFFGRSGDIKNLYQAIMFLGIERIRSLALGMTVLNALPARKSASATNIWIHSYEVAFVASSLSKYIPHVPSGDAFLAGLFHDIGRIVFVGMDPDRFKRVLTSNDPAGEEIAVFGCSHTLAGALLIDTLGIPSYLTAPVQYHHSPLSVPDPANLVASVSLAEGLIGLEKIRPEEDGAWTSAHDVLVRQYKITKHVLDAVYDELVEARPEIEQIFTSP